MDLLNLFPPSTKIGVDGGLIVAGYDIKGLVEAWGTPLYIYDGIAIRQQVQYLKGLLSASYPGRAEIAYAAKAYFSLGFARQLAQMNLEVDVVSLGELEIALRAGFDRDRIHLHGNNKSQAELQLALDEGIQAIVVDSLEELDFLEKLAGRLSMQACIWLRITPGVDVATHPKIQTAHHSSKFGLHIAGGQAAEGIRRVLGSRHLRLTGLHIHLGSQIFDPEPYREAVQLLLDLADSQNYIPEDISTGGGWGVPYHLGMEPVDAALWVDAVVSEVQGYYEKKGWRLPRLVLEPGRWLVARAGVAIYSIGTTKRASDGTYYVAVDGGMADNPRPALYQAQYTACLVNRPQALAKYRAAIVGKFCETGDQLIAEIMLPEVERGDLLAIPVAGAYQLSMASNYNLSGRPAVLWLEKDRVEILQKREQPQDAGWWVD